MFGSGQAVAFGISAGSNSCQLLVTYHCVARKRNYAGTP